MDKNEQENEQQPEQEAKKRFAFLSGLNRFCSKRWFAVVMVGTIFAHGAFLLAPWMANQDDAAVGSPELTLGAFEFVARGDEASPVDAAAFHLHLRLLEDVAHVARDRLTNHRFKVQQEVEELLRRAHGGDFADPNLTELKRQLQEKINDSLSFRAVGEVIITDLDVQRRKVAAPSVAKDEMKESASS